MSSTTRIDKWLWSVRAYKTRSIAATAIKNGRVKVGETTAKPSTPVKEGDTVKVRKPPITYTFRVVGIPPSRVGAKLVPQYLENITPPEEYQILELQKMSGMERRAKGLGRPTKKERRDLDEFMGLPGDRFDWMDDGDDGIEETEETLLKEEDIAYSKEDEDDVLDAMGFWD